MSDHDFNLIQRVIDGDQSALNELYDNYGGQVYNLAMHILRNKTYAEEITQDLFFQIWQEPDKWDPEKGKLISWMLAVTRYMSIDRLRKENRQPGLASESLDDMAHLFGDGSMVDDPRWDNGRLLRSLLKELPKDQIQVIQLAYFKGLTHHEIAAQLNLPLGTVKSRIRLGLQKLRESWKDAVDPHYEEL